MNISGNTILITGGASGIGYALSRRLHSHDNRVIIVGRDAGALDTACSECPGLHAMQADISDENDRQRLVREISDRFPGLNMLINNAGVGFISRQAIDPGLYDNARLEIETNYLAPLRLIQLLFDILRSNPSPAIVNITTIGVYLPLTAMPGYSASKAALSSLTRSLRLRLADTPVKIFEILPPPVDTGLVSDFHTKKMSPERLATKVISGLEKNRYDMAIGSARVLRWMARLAPRISESMSHKLLLKAIRPS